MAYKRVLCLWMIVNCISNLDTAVIFLSRPDKPKIIPDTGKTWFDKEKPSYSLDGPAVGHPFFPEQQSPYKIFDTVAEFSPFNVFGRQNKPPTNGVAASTTHAMKSELSVGKIQDPKLAETLDGDTYYGMRANDPIDPAEKTTETENYGLANKGPSVSSEASIRSAHNDEKARLDSIDSDLHSIPQQQQVQILDKENDYSTNDNFAQASSEDNRGSSTNVEKGSKVAAVDKSDQREHEEPNKNKQDVSNSHIKADAIEGRRPPPINVEEGSASNNAIEKEAVKPVRNNEAPTLSVNDVINSEKAAINFAKQFGDVFPSDKSEVQAFAHELSNEEKAKYEKQATQSHFPSTNMEKHVLTNPAPDIPSDIDHDLHLPSNVHQNEVAHLSKTITEKQPMSVIPKEKKKHHHVTIDTDTGEIINEAIVTMSDKGNHKHLINRDGNTPLHLVNQKVQHSVDVPDTNLIGVTNLGNALEDLEKEEKQEVVERDSHKNNAHESHQTHENNGVHENNEIRKSRDFHESNHDSHEDHDDHHDEHNDHEEVENREHNESHEHHNLHDDHDRQYNSDNHEPQHGFHGKHRPHNDNDDLPNREHEHHRDIDEGHNHHSRMLSNDNLEPFDQEHQPASRKQMDFPSNDNSHEVSHYDYHDMHNHKDTGLDPETTFDHVVEHNGGASHSHEDREEVNKPNSHGYEDEEDAHLENPQDEENQETNEDTDSRSHDTKKESSPYLYRKKKHRPNKLELGSIDENESEMQPESHHKHQNDHENSVPDAFGSSALHKESHGKMDGMEEDNDLLPHHGSSSNLHMGKEKDPESETDIHHELIKNLKDQFHSSDQGNDSEEDNKALNDIEEDDHQSTSSTAKSIENHYHKHIHHHNHIHIQSPQGEDRPKSGFRHIKLHDMDTISNMNENSMQDENQNNIEHSKPFARHSYPENVLASNSVIGPNFKKPTTRHNGILSDEVIEMKNKHHLPNQEDVLHSESSHVEPTNLEAPHLDSENPPFLPQNPFASSENGEKTQEESSHSAPKIGETASKSVLKDDEDEPNGNEYYNMLEGVKNMGKQTGFSPPFDSQDHVHENEVFDNNSFANDIAVDKSSLKRNSKHQKKPSYAMEPKIQDQHEVVEPSYMVHEDPRGDGLGTGVIDGPELGGGSTTSPSATGEIGKREHLNNTSNSQEEEKESQNSQEFKNDESKEIKKGTDDQTFNSNKIALNSKYLSSESLKNEDRVKNAQQNTVIQDKELIQDNNQLDANNDQTINEAKNLKQNIHMEDPLNKETNQDQDKNEMNSLLKSSALKKFAAHIMTNASRDEENNARSNELKRQDEIDEAQDVTSRYPHERELFTPPKSKIFSTIQEHLQSIEVDDLNKLQEEIKAIKSKKMFKPEPNKPEQTVSAISRSPAKAHLNLDVKSNKYKIPERQLTLPLQNPGHPDDMNGVFDRASAKSLKKMPLLNPQPSVDAEQDADKKHLLTPKGPKYVKGSQKDSITRHNSTLDELHDNYGMYKLHGTESELDLEPFVVASKYKTKSKNRSVVNIKHRSINAQGEVRSHVLKGASKISLIRESLTKMMSNTDKTFKRNDTFQDTIDIGDTPEEYIQRKQMLKKKKLKSKKSFLEKPSLKRFIAKSKNKILDIIKTKHFQYGRNRIIKAMDNYNKSDEAKIRKRMLSFKRNAEKRDIS